MIQRNYSLLPHNTFAIEAIADTFIEYTSVDELKELLVAGEVKAPFLHIGGGSNLLFINKHYPGTILHSRISEMKVVEENDTEIKIRVGSGVIWDDFVDFCVSNGWYGAENLSHIPGEVGASAIQNIGAYGVEAKDLIFGVETVNIRGEERVYPVAQCEYAYRYSIFKKPEMKDVFITHVIYRLSKQESYKLEYGNIRQELAGYPVINLENVRKAVIDIRKKKLPDPLVWGNGGSFFMNPVVPREIFEKIYTDYPDMPYYEVGKEHVKIPAGWMIEQCGWKGKSLGPAGVYEKQALVLINLGGATGEDVWNLSLAIRRSVMETFGLDLHPEVCMVGQMEVRDC